PNPAKSVIRVRGPSSVKEVRIYDIAGNLIRVEEFGGVKGETEISLKGVKSGVYFLKLKTKEKEFSEKLIVR
ncbi:MAG: T9SS type A sorting domain-containing protein, partial [candidate division WOR-3 bacterium]|nr:T9SS type A sorting domain-containing protein [candidate division WOR-3 bacterium]